MRYIKILLYADCNIHTLETNSINKPPQTCWFWKVGEVKTRTRAPMAAVTATVTATTTAIAMAAKEGGTLGASGFKPGCCEAVLSRPIIRQVLYAADLAQLSRPSWSPCTRSSCFYWSIYIFWYGLIGQPVGRSACSSSFVGELVALYSVSFFQPFFLSLSTAVSQHWNSDGYNTRIAFENKIIPCVDI